MNIECRTSEIETTNFQNHDQVGLSPKCNFELRFLKIRQYNRIMVMHIFDLFNKHRKYIWQNMILVYENTLRKLGTEGNFGSNSKESAGNAGVPAQLLGQEDPLEKEWLTTHSSMVAWRIPWTEEPGRL